MEKKDRRQQLIVSLLQLSVFVTCLATVACMFYLIMTNGQR